MDVRCRVGADVRGKNLGDPLVSLCVGVQSVRHILRTHVGIGGIKTELGVQIDHGDAVLLTNRLDRLHVVAKCCAHAVGKMVIRKGRSQKLARAKAVAVQGRDEDELARGVLLGQRGDDHVQRAEEGAVGAVLDRAERRFVTVVVGSHKDDDQVGLGNALVAVDQRLVALTVIRGGADAGAANAHGRYVAKREHLLQILIIQMRGARSRGNAVANEDGRLSAELVGIGNAANGAGAVGKAMLAGVSAELCKPLGDLYRDGQSAVRLSVLGKAANSRLLLEEAVSAALGNRDLGRSAGVLNGLDKHLHHVCAEDGVIVGAPNLQRAFCRLRHSDVL